MAHRKLSALTLSLLLATGTAFGEVYQWRDKAGRLHFGDRPPDTVQAKAIAPDSETPTRAALEVNVHHQGFSLGPEAMQELERTLPAIHHLYRRLFGLDMRHTAEVNLNLFEKKPAFDAWVTERTGDARTLPIAGIYLPVTNEVAVWRYSGDNDVLGTLLHEASHVIMAQLSPRAPAWLQEGMAEYFEGLQVTDDELRVAPLARSRARLREWVGSGELISVRSYLSLSNREWRQIAHDASSMPYTVAWGLVYFALSDPSGKRLLRELMQNMEKSQQWAGADVIEARYPGGITRLDYEFFRWAQGEPVPHVYPAP